MLELILNRQYWLKGELHTLIARRGDQVRFREGELPNLGPEEKDFPHMTLEALAKQKRLLLIPEGSITAQNRPLEAYQGYSVVFKHKDMRLLHRTDKNGAAYGFTYTGSVRKFITIRFAALNKTTVKRYSRTFCAKLGLPPQKLDDFFDKDSTVELQVEPEAESEAITSAPSPIPDPANQGEVLHV